MASFSPLFSFPPSYLAHTTHTDPKVGRPAGCGLADRTARPTAANSAARACVWHDQRPAGILRWGWLQQKKQKKTRREKIRSDVCVCIDKPGLKTVFMCECELVCVCVCVCLCVSVCLCVWVWCKRKKCFFFRKNEKERVKKREKIAHCVCVFMFVVVVVCVHVCMCVCVCVCKVTKCTLILTLFFFPQATSRRESRACTQMPRCSAVQSGRASTRRTARTFSWSPLTRCSSRSAPSSIRRWFQVGGRVENSKMSEVRKCKKKRSAKQIQIVCFDDAAVIVLTLMVQLCFQPCWLWWCSSAFSRVDFFILILRTEASWT